jgi:hypothetical protein
MRAALPGIVVVEKLFGQSADIDSPLKISGNIGR